MTVLSKQQAILRYMDQTTAFTNDQLDISRGVNEGINDMVINVLTCQFCPILSN